VGLGLACRRRRAPRILGWRRPVCRRPAPRDRRCCRRFTCDPCPGVGRHHIRGQSADVRADHHHRYRRRAQGITDPPRHAPRQTGGAGHRGTADCAAWADRCRRARRSLRPPRGEGRGRRDVRRSALALAASCCGARPSARTRSGSGSDSRSCADSGPGSRPDAGSRAWAGACTFSAAGELSGRCSAARSARASAGRTSLAATADPAAGPSRAVAFGGERAVPRASRTELGGDAPIPRRRRRGSRRGVPRFHGTQGRKGRRRRRAHALQPRSNDERPIRGAADVTAPVGAFLRSGEWRGAIRPHGRRPGLGRSSGDGGRARLQTRRPCARHGCRAPHRVSEALRHSISARTRRLRLPHRSAGAGASRQKPTPYDWLPWAVRRHPGRSSLQWRGRMRTARVT
jgi:hypothetical protein